MTDFILDTHMAIYRITKDGKVFSRPRRKFPIVGKGMEFTGEFVERLCDEIQLTTRVNNRGYESVCMLKTTKMVHRLVAEGFCANPDNKPFVNHIDGNKLNNHYSNLEWCTAAENNRHARETGLHVQASGHKMSYQSPETKKKALSNLKDNSALSDDEVRYCREVHIPRDREYSATALGIKFGVSAAAMSKILRGETYSHVK